MQQPQKYKPVPSQIHRRRESGPRPFPTPANPHLCADMSQHDDHPYMAARRPVCLASSAYCTTHQLVCAELSIGIPWTNMATVNGRGHWPLFCRCVCKTISSYIQFHYSTIKCRAKCTQPTAHAPYSIFCFVIISVYFFLQL